MSKTTKLILASVMIAVMGPVYAQVIVTESTTNSNSLSRNTNETTTTVKSPPPTAVAPTITSINNDLCTVGSSGAVQTQILGMSFGTTTRDMNCERIKLSKNLFDMGMKVAAVSLMCQDERVFTAMMNAGTPCPIDGKIGEEARVAWDQQPHRRPQTDKSNR
jgi:hypothetical protein